MLMASLERESVLTNCGGNILRAVIDLAVVKAEYLFHEFSSELKSDVNPLIECSRWMHRLMDFVRGVHSACRDHLVWPLVDDMLLKTVGDCMIAVDQSLQVVAGRVRSRSISPAESRRRLMGAVDIVFDFRIDLLLCRGCLPPF